MTEPPPSASPPGLPLEQPGRPFLPGMFDTLKLIIVDPKNAFARMSLTADLARPVIYGLLLGWVSVFVRFMWSFAIQGSILGMLSQWEGVEGILPPMILGLAGGVFGLLVAPVLLLVSIVIWTVIVHLFLMMVGGANHGFATTFRVVCYAQSARLAELMPLFGGMVAMVWGLVLTIIGVAEAHRTTVGRAAAAVLLPVALCCACAAALALTGMLAVLAD